MTEQNCILSEFFLKKKRKKQNKEINTQTHTHTQKKKTEQKPIKNKK